MRLVLDHLTVTDTTPSQLVEIAAATGCVGVGLFLHAMEGLPMPSYDLVTDAAERRATRRALAAGGVGVDLVYPFTLAGRTRVGDFEPALEVAAELGASLANILCYDRDPARRGDRLAELAALGCRYGIGLTVEFYPPSQLRTLGEALAAVEGDIGVTADLLHIMRGDDMAAALPMLGDPRIRIAQLSDGPMTVAADPAEWEASRERLLPGEGAFDIAAFLAAIGPAVPISVEVPRQSALEAGAPALERARRAVEAARAFLPPRAMG